MSTFYRSCVLEAAEEAADYADETREYLSNIESEVAVEAFKKRLSRYVG